MGIISIGKEGYSNNDDFLMNCSMADLIRAAITVGKSRQEAVSISYIERLFRASSILMTVQECTVSQNVCFIDQVNAKLGRHRRKGVRICDGSFHFANC